MTKAEAKRRVCDGADKILDNGENLWLSADEDGSDLSDADYARMREAFGELVAELRRRGGQ
jgi:hypothetical protein